MQPDDLAAVLGLLHRELGWPGDGRAEALWRWKHEENPFGPSSVWVGVERGELVAVRALMRWSLVDASGMVHSAARAVDTATHPGHRRQGWFRELTLAALEDVERRGVTVLFNTPNAQSRAGNLSLGWVEQPTPRVWVRVVRARSAIKLLGSRTSADLWPAPCSVGIDPERAWADRAVADLLFAERRPASGGLITAHSEATVRWRYGLADLGYRIVPASGGVAVVRSRRRGRAIERVLLDSWGDPSALRGALADREQFDHALALGARPGASWVPLPAAGPSVVARPLGTGGLPGRLELVLGDVELL